MRVFVTGASGFVGSHLIPMLISRGFEVSALVRSENERVLVDPKAEIVVGDLATRDSWQEELKGEDVVIHLAAEISSKNPGSFERNNVKATENLILAAKKAKIKKIILFSSAAVTSIRKDLYAKTKEKQESIIKKSKIEHTILRPSMIYGPGDVKNIGWLIRMISKLPIVPLPGGGHFGRQPVYVADICKVVIKLIENKYDKKIYEIHGKEYIPMWKMVKVIISKMNTIKPAIPIPIFFLTSTFWFLERISPNPKFTSDQIASLISGERFSGDRWWEIFDIMPTSFEAGISKMIPAK